MISQSTSPPHEIEEIHPSPSPIKDENLNVNDIKADTLTDIILREVIGATFGKAGVFNVINRMKPDTVDFETMPSPMVTVEKNITTDLSAVDQYLIEIFLKIKENKIDFLESLSVPL